MNELQQYLYNLDKLQVGDFPRKEINYLREHKDEALPYFYETLDNINNLLDKEERKNLHCLQLFVLYLLAEFKDKNSFKRVLEALSFSYEDLYCLYGDVIFHDIKDIVHETYDGNIELLKEKIEDKSISLDIRYPLLQVYMQLYLEGNFSKEEIINYYKKLLISIDDGIKEHLAYAICHCHLMEMIDDVKYLCDNGYVDKDFYGEYDNLLDIMFEYGNEDSNIDIYERLKTWNIFSDDKQIQKELMQKENKAKKESDRRKQSQKKITVGRNDPCPCGSGKKYKKCCMRKDQIEDDPEKQVMLLNYPRCHNGDDEDRIYLDDYFDKESIEIDKLLYLALMDRSRYYYICGTTPIKGKEKPRKRNYLLQAFDLYVDEFNKENLSSNEEYDAKYAIHYTTQQWLKELLDLLDDNDDKYEEVYSYYIK
ncbi:MAG: DUF1186 domain-containing protein [Erysipelotrichaceae bacterium]|nr:DUF1186 domain-containing protein [Erysipelotrichaceae bacterium]